MNAGINGLAEFSSYGPFTDGRIKPDLVAPGQVVRSASSASGIKDGATSERGTATTSGSELAKRDRVCGLGWQPGAAARARVH